jgi:Ca-activated chloride channel family protein
MCSRTTVFAFLSLLCASLSSLGQEAPRIRVDVDLVVANVTVTDPLGRYVVGLEKEHFRVFENKIEQEVIHFSDARSPVSVGIILDTSGSMKDDILSARNSVVRFLKQSQDQDEYFLVTFNNRTRLALDFTSRTENIQNEISIAHPKGRTALYDSLYLGLEKIREGRNEKKALIIITDGEDNRSRYTFSEVKDFAKESDVQIYIIGERGNLGYGTSIISDITRLTGGRPFFPHNFKQLDYFIDLIHTELRTQYVVGYSPNLRRTDGKWHKLRIRLQPPDGLPPLKVRSRQGYFSR